MIQTLRARLTLWYLVIVTLVLTLFAVLLYLAVSRSLESHHDAELARELELVAGRLAGASIDTAARLLEASDGLPMFLMLRREDGTLLFVTRRLRPLVPELLAAPALAAAARAPAPGGPAFLTVALDGQTFRFVSQHPPSPQRTCLQVGRPLGAVNDTLAGIRELSLLLVPLVVLLTSFGGLILARRALKPIEDIATRIREIQAVSLTNRLSVGAAGQELRHLEAAVNQLLERLEGAFESLRHFTSDVSHELQTPLTVVKSSVEIAIRDESIPCAVRSRLQELDREIDHMVSVLSSVRSLSLADDEEQGGHGRADFSSAVAEAVEIASALAEQRRISVHARVTPDLSVWGSAVGLKQVVLNLLDNAVKYSPNGGRVGVDLAAEAEFVTLQVRDSGEGIPPDELPDIFRRRFRGRGASGSAGSGLGLAIARRIVRSHGGILDVRNHPRGGAEFSVRLPRN